MTTRVVADEIRGDLRGISVEEAVAERIACLAGKADDSSVEAVHTLAQVQGWSITANQSKVFFSSCYPL
jgi:hypothetical protein